MQLPEKTSLLIISFLLYSNCFPMGAWHVWSAESEKPKPAAVETPKRIRNPLSLKLMAALTLIRDCDLESNLTIPRGIEEYLEFITRNFHLTSKGYCMQYQALNDAIVNDMYHLIPDIVEYGKNIGDIEFLDNTNFPEKRTPLLFAIHNKNVRLARMLLAQGANPNIAWPVTGQSPLMLAARTGTPVFVELLLAYKADVNKKYGSDEDTALIVAASRGQAGIVKILLDHGADKNSTTTDGSTAAMIARGNGDQKVYELLKN